MHFQAYTDCLSLYLYRHFQAYTDCLADAFRCQGMNHDYTRLYHIYTSAPCHCRLTNDTILPKTLAKQHYDVIETPTPERSRAAMATAAGACRWCFYVLVGLLVACQLVTTV